MDDPLTEGSDGPHPGDLILHTCCGRPSAWQPAGTMGTCSTCGAMLAPEQPYREGHVALLCEDCGQLVGLCGSAVDDEVSSAAAAMLRGAWMADPAA